MVVLKCAISSNVIYCVPHKNALRFIIIIIPLLSLYRLPVKVLRQGWIFTVYTVEPEAFFFCRTAPLYGVLYSILVERRFEAENTGLFIIQPIAVLSTSRNQVNLQVERFIAQSKSTRLQIDVLTRISFRIALT